MQEPGLSGGFGLFDSRPLCVAVPLRPLETFCWAVTLAPCQREAIAINAQAPGREARPIKSTVGSVKHGLPLRFPCPVPWDGNRPELTFGCSSLTSCSPSSPPHRAAERELVCLCCLACPRPHSSFFTKILLGLLADTPDWQPPVCGQKLTIPVSVEPAGANCGECPRGPCKGLGNDGMS